MRMLQATPDDLSSLPSYLGQPPQIRTFLLPAFKMARMKFVLTNIPEEITYDDYWRIAVFVNGHTQRDPYPTSFWFNPHRTLYSQFRTPIDYRFKKNIEFALNLHSMRDIFFRVELQILHGLYTTNINLFQQTMQLDFLPVIERGDPSAEELTG